MSDPDVPTREMLKTFDSVLDPDTAERLLDGRLPVDDAPPAARAVALVINQLANAPTSAERIHEAAAIAAIAVEVRRSTAALPPAARPRRTSRFVRMSAACTMSALTVVGGLATANALPGPAQRVTADVLGTIGVSIPQGNDGGPYDHSPTPSTAQPAAANDSTGSNASSNGKGETRAAPEASSVDTATGGGGKSQSNPSNGGIPPGQERAGSGKPGNNSAGDGHDPQGDATHSSSPTAHDNAPGQVKKQAPQPTVGSAPSS